MGLYIEYLGATERFTMQPNLSPNSQEIFILSDEFKKKHKKINPDIQGFSWKESETWS